MDNIHYPTVVDMRKAINGSADFQTRVAWAKRNQLSADCELCHDTNTRTLKDCPHPQHASYERLQKMYRELHLNLQDEGQKEGQKDEGQKATAQAAPQAATAVVEALGLQGVITSIVQTQLAEAGGLKVDAQLQEIEDAAKRKQAALESMIREALDAVTERAGAYKGIHLVDASGKQRKMEGLYHEAFHEALDLLLYSPNGAIYLVGPAGTGKTHLARQLAEAYFEIVKDKFTDLHYGCDSVNEGTPESYFTGWLLPTGDAGRFEFHETAFLKAYENGGVYVFDEFDRMDCNTASVLNKSLDSTAMDLAKRVGRTECKRHEAFRAIAIGNTVGNGGSETYAAANLQDAATMNRFGGQIVFVDYDLRIERVIALTARGGAGGSQQAVDKAQKLLAAMRDAIKRGGLSHVASYRQCTVCAGQWARADKYREAGKPVPSHLTDKAIIDRALLSWSTDEAAMVDRTAL